MDKYKIIYSTDAWEDLKQIRNHITFQLQTPRIAAIQINQIRNAINSLDILPKRYNIVDFEPWKSNELRKMPINNYIVFYWIDEENSVVKIVNIIYSRRNLQEALKSNNYSEDSPALFINEEREPYGTK